MAASESRRADSKGRIALPGWAGAMVLVEQVSATEFRVRKAQVIPEDELDAGPALKPLSDKDRDLFLAALDAPPKPVRAVSKAAAKHRKRHG